jgi:hypothetical protein
VLLRLAYLGVTNVFALLRLLPRSDHDKDTEILALRIRILGATPHPTAAWSPRPPRNLVTDLHDAGSGARYLIRDRDSVRIPRLNAVMERWVGT